MTGTVPFLTEEALAASLSELGLLTPAVGEALALARKEHGKARRDDDSPYLEEHIYPVALATARYAARLWPLAAERATIIALLHDVLEDVPGFDKRVIARRFGAEVASGVQALTKPTFAFWPFRPGERERRYFAALRAAPPLVQTVKVFDRLNNLACLHKASPRKRQRYLAETWNFHLPLACALDPDLARQMEELLSTLA